MMSRGNSPCIHRPSVNLTLQALSPDKNEISLYMITACVEYSSDKNKGSDH